MTELPQPRVLAFGSDRNPESVFWLRVFYDHGLLTPDEFAELEKHLRAIAPLDQVIQEDLEDGTIVHLEISSDLPELEIPQKYTEMFAMLSPRHRSCQVRISKVIGKNIAVFTITCAHPYTDAASIGAALKLLLDPLGEDVAYLPNALVDPNQYRIVVESYRRPDNIGEFLTENIPVIGLDLSGYSEFDITDGEYLAMIMSRHRLS